MSRTIAHAAITAYGETKRSGRRKHYGKRPGTRKNSPVIAVDFGLDMPARPWCITWTAK